MLLYLRTNCKQFFLSAGVAFSLLVSFNSHAQVGISGATNASANISYNYYPTYNGTGSYWYSDWYSWSITSIRRVEEP